MRSTPASPDSDPAAVPAASVSAIAAAAAAATGAVSADGRAPPGPPLLVVEDLTIDVEGGDRAVRVVDGVGFRIGRGERFALVGESGSGKTLTAQAILRLTRDARYGGSVRFEGRSLLEAPESTLRGIRGREIAMIFQEPMAALNPLYTIGEQIGEVLVRHLGLTRAQARQRAVELLDLTQVREPQRRCEHLPHQLSGGQRQRAMIAMALACQPKLVIADEPTTALDVTVQAQILALLSDLQREIGMAVLLITHDLPLVRAFAERVAVMSHGRILEQGAVVDVFEAPRHDDTRRLLDARPPRMVSEMVADEAGDRDGDPNSKADGRAHGPVETDDTGSARPARGRPVLSTRQLRCVFESRAGWFRRHRFEAVRGVDLTLAAGRTLGVVGESGSGKTTLAMSILRLAAGRVSGEIRVAGQRLDTLSDRRLRLARRQVQMVFQDPFNALSPRLTVGRIVGEGLQLHRPELGAAARDALVREALADVGLDPAMMPRYPHEFSGGQRQRIAIARALVLRPAVLVLDEPTSALDLTVQLQVLKLLVSLQQRYGISYLLITHDLAVIRAIAHRLVVMKEGVVVEQGPVERVFAAPADPYTRTLLGAMRRLEAGPARG